MVILAQDRSTRTETGREVRRLWQQSRKEGNGSAQGARCGGGERWLDSAIYSEGKATGFPEYEGKKGLTDDSKLFSLSQLERWNCLQLE